MAHAVGFAFPEGATMISGIDMSSHITLWIMLKLIDPSNLPAFMAGAIALVMYGGLWFWTRNDIKSNMESQQEKTILTIQLKEPR